MSPDGQIGTSHKTTAFWQATHEPHNIILVMFAGVVISIQVMQLQPKTELEKKIHTNTQTEKQ